MMNRNRNYAITNRGRPQGDGKWRSVAGTSSLGRGAADGADWRRKAMQMRRSQLADPRPDWCHITIKDVAKEHYREVIERLSVAVPGKRFMPLFARLTDDSDLTFYLTDQEMGNAITDASTEVRLSSEKKLSISKKISKPPVMLLDGVQVALLKRVVERRLNTTTMTLDLSRFSFDEELTRYKVHFPLYRSAVSIALVEILAELMPNVATVDASYNNLRHVDCLGNLMCCIPNVVNLKLDDNEIGSFDELLKICCWRLTSLTLVGNPLMDVQNLREAARLSLKAFPELQLLDGEEISGVLDLPAVGNVRMKGSYLINDQVGAATVSFLNEYFSIFDSDIADLRSGLVRMYDPVQSHFTVCIDTNQRPNFIPMSKRWRRLSNKSHNILCRNIWKNRAEQLEMHGGLSIAVFMKDFIPETKHEMGSVLMDVAMLSNEVVACVLNGYLRDAECAANEMRQFHRIFILKDQGNGITISNDMAFYCGSTTSAYSEHVRIMAKIDSEIQAEGGGLPPSAAGAQVAVSAVDEESVKNEMIQRMSEMTRMKQEWAAKCLMDNNWQFEEAYACFIKLNERGGIPSGAFH